MKRLDLLSKLGIKDMPINSEEASAITGLAKNTLCRYATLGHFSSYKYPNRNLYPLREMCEWVLKHYHGVVIRKTSDLNKYKPIKRGRPKKGVKV